MLRSTSIAIKVHQFLKPPLFLEGPSAVPLNHLIVMLTVMPNTVARHHVIHVILAMMLLAKQYTWQAVWVPRIIVFE